MKSEPIDRQNRGPSGTDRRRQKFTAPPRDQKSDGSCCNDHRDVVFVDDGHDDSGDCWDGNYLRRPRRRLGVGASFFAGNKPPGRRRKGGLPALKSQEEEDEDEEAGRHL